MEQWLPFIGIALAMAVALWVLVRFLGVPAWIIVPIALFWPAPLWWKATHPAPNARHGPGDGLEWIFIIPIWLICLVATIVLVAVFRKR